MTIKHSADGRMCWWDSKASTVTSYTRFSNGYDVTALALLSRWHVRDMARCSIIVWLGKSIFHFDFLIDMFWIKPTKMCSIITSVHNMKILIISKVSYLTLYKYTLRRMMFLLSTKKQFSIFPIISLYKSVYSRLDFTGIAWFIAFALAL